MGKAIVVAGTEDSEGEQVSLDYLEVPWSADGPSVDWSWRILGDQSAILDVLLFFIPALHFLSIHHG